MRILLALILALNISCSSMSKMVKRIAGTDQPKKEEKVKKEPVNTYNNKKNYKAAPIPNRRYGRMNRDRFEQEAQVDEEAGSLWVDEGQSSYLFSQNQNRLEGDVLNIQLEKQAKDQLNNKIATIGDLLQKRKEAIAKRREAIRKRKTASKDRRAKAEEEKKSEEASNKADAAEKPKEKTADINFNKIPSRIMASYPDGSYRVKGTKTILIQDKEFQVLISGLARGNDIKDDAVASNKLLDAKFDIIRSRRTK